MRWYSFFFRLKRKKWKRNNGRKLFGISFSMNAVICMLMLPQQYKNQRRYMRTKLNIYIRYIQTKLINYYYIYIFKVQSKNKNPNSCHECFWYITRPCDINKLPNIRILYIYVRYTHMRSRARHQSKINVHTLDCNRWADDARHANIYRTTVQPQIYSTIIQMPSIFSLC